MIFAAAVAAAPPAATPTPGFAEAEARSERYADQFNDYRIGQFYGVLGPLMQGIADRCPIEPPKAERRFKLVVSFAGGKLAGVETDNADPIAACYQAELARVSYPAPPVPDFAERITMVMMPEGAEPPKQTDRH